MWMIATTQNVRIPLINIYAPDSSHTSEIRKQVLNWTEFIISQKILSNNIAEYILVAGDFN